MREVISINYGVHYTKYNGISLLSAMHPPEFKAMVNEDINALKYGIVLNCINMLNNGFGTWTGVFNDLQ